MKIPQKGQSFFMLNSRFEVIQTTNSGSEKSRKRIAVGNWFETKEQAEEFKQHVLKGTTQIIYPTHIQVEDRSIEQPIDVKVRKKWSEETLARAFTNNMLGEALNHASGIMEYAAIIIASGSPHSSKDLRKMQDNFKKIHRTYEKNAKQIIVDFSKELGE